MALPREIDRLENMPGPYKKVGVAYYQALKSYWLMVFETGEAKRRKGKVDIEADKTREGALFTFMSKLAPYLPQGLLLYETPPSQIDIQAGPIHETIVIYLRLRYYLPATNELYMFTPNYHFGSEPEKYDPKNPAFMGFDQLRGQQVRGLFFERVDQGYENILREVHEERGLKIIIEAAGKQVSDGGKSKYEQLTTNLAEIDQETEERRGRLRLYYGNLLSAQINNLSDAVFATPDKTWFNRPFLPKYIALSTDVENDDFSKEQKRHYSVKDGKIVLQRCSGNIELEAAEWARNYNARIAIDELIKLLPSHRYQELREGSIYPMDLLRMTISEKAHNDAHREAYPENYPQPPQ